MRILVSGSRDGFKGAMLLAKELNTALEREEQLTIVEGCAPGVDSLAERWARHRRAKEVFGRERHFLPPDTYDAPLVLEHWPAQWNLHVDCWCNPGVNRCKYAGPRRNLEMASSGVDRVIACSDDLAASRGTRHMATTAHRIGLPLTILGCEVSTEQLDRWAREQYR